MICSTCPKILPPSQIARGLLRCRRCRIAAPGKQPVPRSQVRCTTCPTYLTAQEARTGCIRCLTCRRAFMVSAPKRTIERPVRAPETSWWLTPGLTRDQFMAEAWKRHPELQPTNPNRATIPIVLASEPTDRRCTDCGKLVKGWHSSRCASCRKRKRAA